MNRFYKILLTVGKIKRDINKIKHELDLEKSLNINGTIKDIKKEFEVFKEAENDLKEGFNEFEKSLMITK